MACLVLAVLAASTSAKPAAADDSPEVAEAKRRMTAGGALFQRGKYEEARLQYVEACTIVQSEKCFFSLSVVELKTNHPLDAYRHMQRVMADGPFVASLEPAFLKTAESTRTAAYVATGHATVHAPTGARIVLDGTDIGEAPLPNVVDVMPGEHTLEARSGEQKKTLHVSVLAGLETPVTLAFETTGPTAAAVVPLGTASPDGSGSAHPDGNSPYWNERRTIGVVLAGVGVVGMVVGGVFGGLRGGETSDANTARAQVGPGSSACNAPSAAQTTACASERSALQSNSTDAHLEAGFLIGGGALVAAGLVTALWPASAKATTAGLSPAVGPQMAGVQWAGSF